MEGEWGRRGTIEIGLSIGAEIETGMVGGTLNRASLQKEIGGERGKAKRMTR